MNKQHEFSSRWDVSDGPPYEICAKCKTRIRYPTECPGVPSTDEQRQGLEAKTLDYFNGQWWLADSAWMHHPSIVREDNEQLVIVTNLYPSTSQEMLELADFCNDAANYYSQTERNFSRIRFANDAAEKLREEHLERFSVEHEAWREQLREKVYSGGGTTAATDLEDAPALPCHECKAKVVARHDTGTGKSKISNVNRKWFVSCQNQYCTNDHQVFGDDKASVIRMWNKRQRESHPAISDAPKAPSKASVSEPTLTTLQADKSDSRSLEARVTDLESIVDDIQRRGVFRKH